MFNRKRFLSNCSVERFGDCQMCVGEHATILFNRTKICQSCYDRVLKIQNDKIKLDNPRIISRIEFKDEHNNSLFLQFRGFVEDYNNHIDFINEHFKDYTIIKHEKYAE